MNTAQLLKNNLKGFRGHAALYRLNPPLREWDGENAHELVVLSTVDGFGRPETLIFPADETGTVTSRRDLRSQISMSHQQVLEDAGYTMVNA
jgi:hypothetical protein